MVHTWNPSTSEVEACRSLQLTSQIVYSTPHIPGQQKTLS